MDALFAFDNAVEKLLAFLPIEPLPEQLAELRFLFEEELWLGDLRGVENVERIHQDPGASRG